MRTIVGRTGRRRSVTGRLEALGPREITETKQAGVWIVIRTPSVVLSAQPISWDMLPTGALSRLESQPRFLVNFIDPGTRCEMRLIQGQ